MKTFVAGATGVAGRAAVDALVAEGHQVTAVARSDNKAGRLTAIGARPVRVDLFYPGAVAEAVRGHDAVVNLATKIPTPQRALLPRAWAENDRIRRQVSKNLVDASLAADVNRFVQESLAFVYPDSGDESIDEEMPLDPPPHAVSVVDAEREVARFAATRTGVVLRFGQFYAAGTAHTETMIAAAEKGISPFVGPRDGFVSLIYADDVGRAVAKALQVPSGTYNVVDDEPMRRAELDRVLAQSLGRSKLRSLPPALARAGGSKVRMLMRSQRVSNRRLKAAGWEPLVKTARDGFPRVVEERRRT